jgi:tRNA(fMet)-specific endonuclease VapC
MELIVDTNVVSFIFKNDSRSAAYESDIDGRETGISFVSVAELYRWAVQRAWGQKRIDDLRTELRRYLVLPPDEAIAWNWARIKGIKGHPMSSEDAWVAAAALHFGLPLLTHNRKHFEHVISHAP